ncbi:hypothetical protein K1T71_010944 [Dendrolimus kikuchii]|uniref:Uncharacterized protein n=1 Tax=Dendrolimus kikuchii TaxID=765133 RepID=A0ACC1CQ98_9NEOP|nr:hypothetical protein K1T71_010944 [Dendrolimus kikuchii]
MEYDTIEFTLPPAPRGLCFDRNDFVKTNFSVDSFLAEHQNVTSLESMRDDLGMYLKVLRLAMIELINKDYANFVNLCATLIGFDKTIIKIQVPLEQLNEEVYSVKQCLEDAMKELSMWLNQRHGLQKKKQLLKYYSQTMNCLKTLESVLCNIYDKNKHERIVLADRAAMQYNQLKFSIFKCESLVKQEQKHLFKDIGERLIQTLNELLFQFWNENDEENLLKTLITLASLDRVLETEMLIRKQAVAPLLQDIINEPALQRSKDGLEGLYERILTLLDTKLKLLLIVTQHSKLSFLDKQYMFLINCFWREVENRLEVNLASIFAPGNPQIFYKRYNESIQFIKKLELFFTSDDMVKMLRETIEYKSFKKRWNLPVYFQIRFQEIAGNYEASLQKSPTLEANDGFVLRETHRCWKALQECWSDGIYIEALAHKFWKLSLQLISRYSTWASVYCNQVTSSKTEPNQLNKTLIENSINIYIDIQALLQRLPSFLQHVESKIHISQKAILENSLKGSINSLEKSKEHIKDCIVNELEETLNMQLKQVCDIPRLYRKTNRSVPTKACTYMDLVATGIKEFSENAKRLDNKFLTSLYADLFDVMTASYYTYVEYVLTSVQKTEDSLRRLKQIRETTSSNTNDNAGVTDGDKIRLQLHVDVVSYGKIAESLKLNVNNVKKYNEMYNMVTEAVKNIDIK